MARVRSKAYTEVQKIKVTMVSIVLGVLSRTPFLFDELLSEQQSFNLIR